MDRKNIKKRLIFWYTFLWLFLFFALYQAYCVYFVDLTSTKSKWVGLFAGAIGALFASLKVCEITFLNPQDKIFKQITSFFRNGNFIFEYKINRYVLIITALLSVFLFKPLGFGFVLCLIIGAVLTITLNSINNSIFNYSTAKANSFLNESFSTSNKINFFSSISIGLLTIAFAIIPIVILYHAFKDYQIISGYVLGVGLYYFCSSANYIITKFALQISKEPLLNSFQNLTLYDKRNPLLLLNGLFKGILSMQYYTNNILFSYCLAFVGAITIGAFCLNLMGAFLPIIILSNGLFAGIICALLTKLNKTESQIKPLYIAFFAQLIIFSLLTYWTMNTWLLEGKSLIISPILGGVFAFICCCLNLKETYNSKTSKEIINSSTLGQYCAWVQVIKSSLKNIFLPVMFLILMILFAFLAPNGIEAPLLGIYGISLSICGFFAVNSILLISQIFAISLNNTNKIISTYEKEIDITQIEEKRNYINKTTRNIFSINKNYALFATFLSTLCAFIAYTLVCYIEEMDILNPYILANLIFGATFGLFFASKLFSNASKNGLKLIIESKKQFRKNPQILEYQESANFIQPIKSLLDNNIIQITSLLILFAIVIYIDIRYLKYEAIAGCLFAMSLVGFGISIFANNIENNAKSAQIYYENTYFKSKEHAILTIIKNISKFPYGLIYGAYDILIKFMAIVLLALAMMFI